MTKGRMSILLSSGKMAIATFLSRILGLIREQVMAAIFGASGITDAFLIAYRIPNMLRDLLAEGAFSSAFVPTFAEVKQRGPEEARRLLWSVFILLGGITAAISLGMIIFARPLTGLFAPEFLEQPDKLALTTDLLRIMAPYLFLVSVAALFMGVLNSLKVFFLPSLSSAFFNVIMIISTLFLPAIMVKLGWHPALALGIGVTAGGILQAIVQIPQIFKLGYGPIKGEGMPPLWTPETRRILNRLGIGTIGIAATQINLLVSSILATGSGEGAVSWLTYAFRLFQFPVGILGVSIAGSNLVHFSDAWKTGKKEEAIQFLRSSYTLSLLVLVPSLTLLHALSQESVNLVFQRGEFVGKDTEMTAMALKWYMLGLPFYGLYKLFAPVFYTLDQPRTPVIISSLTILLNIAFCLWATPRYGFEMLAIGTTLSMFVNVFWQSLALQKKLKLSFDFFMNARIVKIILAGFLSWWLTRLLAQHYYNHDAVFFMKVLSFCLIGIAGALSYGVGLLLLGEWKELRNFYYSRVKKSGQK